jgi:hypothetical protein
MNFNAQPNSFNVRTNYPVIANPKEVYYQYKYVSIHSEDRDIKKYPNSAEFDIELPEDISNISTARLSTWTFPSNYNAFSANNSNITMTFKIVQPYNPGEHSYTNPLQNEIFSCLFLSGNDDYTIVIEEGFYDPEMFVTELNNKFNYAVTMRIQTYLTNADLLNEFALLGGYNRFIIVYNDVSQKIWFGNTADAFVLTNETILSTKSCENRSQLPDSVNWGLPHNVGLSKKNVSSSMSVGLTPRFYYGNVSCGDNGYWLLPDSSLPESACSYIECPYKINLMGPSYFYLEIVGMNCIDETSPFNANAFTAQTNETNGRTNASFAKIAIPTTPLTQWFDRDSTPCKYFSPPAERIRRLRIKLRYHDNELVNFGLFDYSFMIEFMILHPQQMNSVDTFRRQM